MMGLRLCWITLGLLGWASAAQAQTVLTAGHTDFIEVKYSSATGFEIEVDTEDFGDFEAVFDNIDNVWRFAHPDGVIFRLDSPGTTFTRPAGAQWNFLGASAGQTVYGGVQNGDENTHFQFGYGDSSTYIPGSLVNDEVTFTFSIRSGPAGGAFSYYQTTGATFNSPFDPLTGQGVLVSTADGIFSFTGFLTHTDRNLIFNLPGFYEIEVFVSGIDASSQQLVTSDSYVYLFQVAAIPEPTTLALVGVVAAGTLANRRVRAKLLRKS